MLDLEFAELSETGPTREKNEDRCGHFVPATQEAARSRGWGFAVADGVGGQVDGEIASRIAIEALLSGLPSVSSSEPLTVALPRLIRTANERIFEYAGEYAGEHSGTGHRSGPMATTIVACAIRYDRAAISHVGDSRCYLIRRGSVTALTADHTVASEQFGMGILTSREAASARTASLLTRALGNELFVNIDTIEQVLTPGDVLMLCSDGLHRAVTAEELAEHVHPEAELNAAAARLVELANTRDGSDNVTVQLVRIRAVERVGMYRGRLYKLPETPTS